MRLSKCISIVISTVVPVLTAQSIDVPNQISISDAIVMSIQGDHDKNISPITPKLNSKPILNGLDHFSVRSYRDRLLALGGTSRGFQTVQEIRDKAKSYSGAGAIAIWMTGYYQLWNNWAIAVMMGDREKAIEFYLEATASGSPALFPSPPDLNPKPTHAREYLSSAILRLNATAISVDIASIPSVVDPEGHVRQRLQHVYEEMINKAQALEIRGY